MIVADQRLISDRFPRALKYHPDWVIAGVSGAANPLWRTEWLSAALDLRPGMRVLDLGCVTCCYRGALDSETFTSGANFRAMNDLRLV